jgi:type 2 lantibiotic biosynthesis protein LanM
MLMTTFMPEYWRGLNRIERLQALYTALNSDSAEGVLGEIAKDSRFHFLAALAKKVEFKIFYQTLLEPGVASKEQQELFQELEQLLAKIVLDMPEDLTAWQEAWQTQARAGEGLMSRQPTPSLSFLTLVAPLTQQAFLSLQNSVKKLSRQGAYLPFDLSSARQLLSQILGNRLGRILTRTLLLELNVARLQGRLEGNTPEERFQFFCRSLADEETVQKILNEYPVLARQLARTTKLATDFVLQFLNHLAQDWALLSNTFSPDGSTGMLVEVRSGLGDTHRGGQCVMELAFASGLRLIYKPRSLSIDVHFQELLAWFNDKGFIAPFRTLTVLDCQTHGWVEHVRAEACQSAEELERFYQRQGANIALLYVLGARDFHYENLIASGEHPVLIDLEALFSQSEKLNQAGSLSYSERIANNTVMSSLLLPYRAGSKGLDVSGLNSMKGQRSSEKSFKPIDIGTDAMRLIQEEALHSEGHNIPTMAGERFSLSDYEDSIFEGFTSLYRLLLAHRQDFLRMLSPFANDEIRIIFRATRVYGTLLEDAFHPDVLGNTLERDKLFDCLWDNTAGNGILFSVLCAEREALWNNDIPIFTSKPGSRELWANSAQPLGEAYNEASLSLVLKRINHLSEDDLARQKHLISQSLRLNSPSLATATSSEKTLRLPDTDFEQFLSAASALGDRLSELAIYTPDGEVGWMAIKMDEEGNGSIHPLGIDLYNSLPGLLLFLAYLGSITKQNNYISLAKRVLKALILQIDEANPYMRSPGAYDGWSGIIYALTHLASLWEDPALLAKAKSIVELLPGLIREDRSFDIVNGSAGCIASLLALYAYAPDQGVLDLAVEAGQHLVGHAKPMLRGWAWETMPSFTTQPATGFAHGAAGIGWALLQLGKVAKEQSFIFAAQEAFEYERSVFAPEMKNWPDFRVKQEETAKKDESIEPKFMNAWCHGAIGIGLSRLDLAPYPNDPAIEAEIEAALEATASYGLGLNHSLCHGALGGIELILEASRKRDPQRWLGRLQQISASVLAEVSIGNYRCGTPNQHEVPGLMTGLAGIGYGLLRLAAPDQVPSVLLLHPPVRRKS